MKSSQEAKLPKIVLPKNLLKSTSIGVISPSSTIPFKNEERSKGIYCALPPTYTPSETPTITPGSVPMSHIITRVIQKAYSELENTLDILPRQNNIEKRRTLFHYFSTVKTLFSALLAMRIWFKYNADDILHAQNEIVRIKETEFLSIRDILTFFNNLSSIFISSAVTQADILTSLNLFRNTDVLPISWFPIPMYLKNPSSSDFEELNYIIRKKLFHSDLKFQVLSISNGIALFSFFGKIVLHVTLTSHMQQWRILKVSLTKIHPKYDKLDLQILIPSLQELSNRDTFEELYSVLHQLYLSIRVSILYEQAISFSLLHKMIHISLYNEHVPSFEVELCQEKLLIRYGSEVSNYIEDSSAMFHNILDHMSAKLIKNKLATLASNIAIINEWSHEIEDNTKLLLKRQNITFAWIEFNQIQQAYHVYCYRGDMKLLSFLKEADFPGILEIYKKIKLAQWKEILNDSFLFKITENHDSNEEWVIIKYISLPLLLYISIDSSGVIKSRFSSGDEYLNERPFDDCYRLQEEFINVWIEQGNFDVDYQTSNDCRSITFTWKLNTMEKFVSSLKLACRKARCNNGAITFTTKINPDILIEFSSFKRTIFSLFRASQQVAQLDNVKIEIPDEKTVNLWLYDSFICINLNSLNEITVISDIERCIKDLIIWTILSSEWNMLALLESWNGIIKIAMIMREYSLNITALSEHTISVDDNLLIEQQALSRFFVLSSYDDSLPFFKIILKTFINGLSCYSKKEKENEILFRVDHYMLEQKIASLSNYLILAKHWTKLVHLVDPSNTHGLKQCMWIKIDEQAVGSGVITIESHIWKHQIWWNVVDNQWSNQIIPLDLKVKVQIFTFEDGITLVKFLNQLLTPNDVVIKMHDIAKRTLDIISLWSLPAIVMKDFVKIIQSSIKLPAHNLSHFGISYDHTDHLFEIDHQEGFITIFVTFWETNSISTKLKYLWNEKKLWFFCKNNPDIESKLNQGLHQAITKSNIAKMTCNLYYSILYLSKALYIEL